MRQTNSLCIHRRILSVILALAVLLLALPAWSITADSAELSGEVMPLALEAEEITKGSGTEGDPYLIETAGQLKKLADNVNGGTAYENTYFKLTEDIDLGGSEGNQWTPIGSGGTYFKGTFDGGGHKITGLYINKPNVDYQALFRSVVGGVVKNLGVEGSVTALSNVGGIAASISARSTIDGCYSNVRIISDSGSYFGGIAGTVWNGCVIKNCYNIGDVIGSADRIGGIVGFNYAGEIQNCYNTGTVQGSTIGGIVGYSYDGAKVQNCYNIGLVEAVGEDGSVGSIAGYSSYNNSNVQNCFFLSGTLENGVGGGSGTNTNVTGIDTAAFALQTTFDAYWDFKTVWKMSSLHGRPVLIAVTEEAPKLKGGGDSETDPYLINTANDLVLLATLVNGGNNFAGKYIKLTRDIDLNGDSNNQWTPIGDYSNSFSGTFDGNGKTISGLYIDSSQRYQGLFGYIRGGTVKNLGVINGSVTSTHSDGYVGGIAGRNNGGKIIGCYNTCNVTGRAGGGIVGATEGNATVTDCYNSGVINGGENGYVGGVVGSNDNNATITNCYNTNKVSGTDNIGGIVGFSNGTVTNCHNTGDVSGNNKVGGISGCYGKITNCYNAGKISGGDKVGGIIGNTQNNKVENCYNVGSIECLGNSGGIGYCTNVNYFTNCYYLEGMADGALNGEDTETVRAMTEAEFNSGEVAWLLQSGQDSQNTLVWGQELKNSPNDNYPVLTNDNNKRVYQVKFKVGDTTDSTAYTNSGGTVTVSDPDTANVPSGKAFDHWEYNGSAFTGSTQVTGDITVTAVLTVNKPDLTDVTVTIEKGTDYIKVTLTPEIEDAEFYYTDNGTEHTSSTGEFTGLTPGKTYEIYVRYEGSDEGEFVAEVTTVNEDGSTTLKHGETVKNTNKGEDVTNKDGEATVKDGSGNETTVTLPEGKTDVEIDKDGNVIAPGGSTVTPENGPTLTVEDDATVSADGSVTFPDGGDITVGGTTVTVPEGGTVEPNGDGSVTVPKNSVVKGSPDITLPDGGVIDKDGNVLTDELEIGDTVVEFPADTQVETDGDGNVVVPDGTVVTPPSGKPQIEITDADDKATVDKDGNVTFPDGGTAKVGDTTVDVPAGGTLEPVGDSLVKVPAGSTVNGDTLTDDGILDENGNLFEGAVKIGDVLFIPPEGETVTDNGDGTVTVPEDTVVVPGNGTDYTVECEGGKVDSTDGSVTLPEDGSIKLGNTEITTPDGGTLTPNDDGTVTVPDGSVVTPPSGAPDITITDGEDKAAVDRDGNVTFPDGGDVKIGDATVTVPEGGTIEPNEDGKVLLPKGSTVTKKDGTTSTVLDEGGAVYDPATGELESSGSGSGSGSKPGNSSGNNSGNTSDPSEDSNDPSEDTSTPSTGDNTNGADNVNVGTVSGENAPKATIDENSLNKLKEEIIAEHLTPEEKAAVENGATLDIILSVEVAEGGVPAEDKQAAEAVLLNTEYTLGTYLNIELIKLINGQPVGKITELITPIRVTIEIPEELRSANREFVLVRVHNGEADILEDVDNAPDTITIVTDKFSTYSIAYRDIDANPDANPNTGKTTPIAITGLACAVIVAAVAVKKKKMIE